MEIVGKKYNRLTVIEYAGMQTINRADRIQRQSTWTCLCECGNKITVRRNNLVSGNTKSCGCLLKENYLRLKNKGIQNNILPEGEAAFNAYLGSYKYRAKIKSIQFELTDKEFRELIYKNCYFCGEKPFRQYPTKKKSKDRPYNGSIFINGIDRVDSQTGYIKNNCVSCCEICNKAKRNLTMNQFSVWIKKIAEYQSLSLGMITI